MPQTLWLRATPHRPIEWLMRDAQGRLLAGPSALRADSLPGSAESTILVWCDPSLMLRRVEVPKSGVAKWRTGLPYLAEDWIAGDVADVHVVAPARIVGRQCLVAVAERARLQAMIDELSAYGIDPDRVVPEPSLLGPQANADVLIDGEMASFATADSGGCTEPDLLGLLVPADARVMIGRPPADPIAGDHVESALRWASLQRVDDMLPNLRGGEFAAQRRSTAATPYRTAAFALAAALLVHTGALAVEWYRLQRDVAAAEARIEAAFREAFGPDARMVDPAFQIQQALGGGERTDAGALALLRQVAPMLASDSRLILVSFEYRDGALELAVRAPDATRFDGLREQLASSGLSIEMGSTQYEANEFTGRLKIRGAG